MSGIQEGLGSSSYVRDRFPVYTFGTCHTSFYYQHIGPTDALVTNHNHLDEAGKGEEEHEQLREQFHTSRVRAFSPCSRNRADEVGYSFDIKLLSKLAAGVRGANQSFYGRHPGRKGNDLFVRLISPAS